MRKLFPFLAALSLLCTVNCGKSRRVSPKPFAPATYHFIAPGSLRCWNISTNEQQKRLTVNTCSDSDANEAVTISDYKLQWSAHYSYCLEFVGGVGDTPPLQQMPCTGQNTQDWIMQPTGDGYWAILNSGWNDHCITRPGDSQGENDGVFLVKCTGQGASGWDASQKWTIREVTLTPPVQISPEPVTPAPLPSAESQISDASMCTPQSGSGYSNCQLGLHNNSGKNIMVIAVTWSGLSYPDPPGYVEKHNILVPAGQTKPNIQFVWKTGNAPFNPTNFHVTKAAYQ